MAVNFLSGTNPAQWALAGIGGASILNGPGYNNPADAAMPYLKQIGSSISPYLSPYIDQGNKVSPELMSRYSSMSSNPGGFLNEIGKGYKSSPGYQWNLQQALMAGNNAAAAGGMAGTPMHVQQNEGIAENMANKDYEDWLNHTLGIFGQGTQGLEGFTNRGFNASNSMAEALAQARNGQAGLAA